jgi:hypothetical protein
MNVSALKREIKRENGGTFELIDAKGIQAWAMAIPLINGTEGDVSEANRIEEMVPLAGVLPLGEVTRFELFNKKNLMSL